MVPRFNGIVDIPLSLLIPQRAGINHRLDACGIGANGRYFVATPEAYYHSDAIYLCEN
jgi:hypothetical protein